MKKQNRKIILIVIVILILCIFFFQNKKKFNNQFQDELIFFKLFSSKQENSENMQKSEKSESQISQAYESYRFYVSYHNIDFKNINLTNSINRDTLVHEKIAPGTKGAFEILLETNEKIHYQIKFKSKNQKPENLTFKIEGKDKKYNKLEEMEEDLQGEIKENKRIIINWQWEYETSETQNRQDTEDGKKIRQYHFTIYAIGQ